MLDAAVLFALRAETELKAMSVSASTEQRKNIKPMPMSSESESTSAPLSLLSRTPLTQGATISIKSSTLPLSITILTATPSPNYTRYRNSFKSISVSLLPIPSASPYPVSNPISTSRPNNVRSSLTSSSIALKKEPLPIPTSGVAMV